VYYQSDNLKFHHQIAADLLSKGKAFSCFCSQETLKEKQRKAQENNQPYRYDGTCETLSNAEVLDNEAPFVIRIKTPHQTLDNEILLHYDKTPTRVFACAVDDMLQGIGHVIREEDCITDMPMEEHIRHSLGYEADMHYVHVSPLSSHDQEKVPCVTALLEQGFLPEAIANYLLLLGSTPPSEVFTLNEACTWFNLTSLSTSPAHFNKDKLYQLNREHIKRMDEAKLAGVLDFSGEDFGKLAKVYTNEAFTLSELKPRLHAIFSPKPSLEGHEAECDRLFEALENLPYCEDFATFKTMLTEATGLKDASFDTPLRHLLTGALKGPALGEIYPYIKPYLKEIIRR
jgi:glutamyl-tRNA synthetase